MSEISSELKAQHKQPLTKDQRRAFLAGYGGWSLDGFDALLFGLVFVPSLTELLTNGGIAATPGNIGFYGQVITAVFLAGWGFSALWGPIADRFGRIKILMISLLMYSVFTALAGLTTEVWQIMACRFFGAIGTGAEWAIAGTLVAEAIPERRRVFFGGLLHSGFYVGGIAAALINIFFGAQLGWRGMLLIGLIPAVFVVYIRFRVKEDPKMFREAAAVVGREPIRARFGQILGRAYGRRTWAMVFIIAIALMGYWATTQYLTTAAAGIAGSLKMTPADVRLVSVSVFGLSTVCTAIGCIIVPFLCQRFGRRATLSVLFGLMIIGILGVYGWALPTANVPLLYVFAVVLGFGGSNFAVFTIWLPELFPTHLRATGFAFATSASRFIAAGGTFLVGWGIAWFGSASIPLSLTAVPFLVGFILVRLAPEMRGEALPK